MWTILAKLNDQLDNYLTKNLGDKPVTESRTKPTEGIPPNLDPTVPEDRAVILEFVRRPGMAEKYGITKHEIQTLEDMDTKHEEHVAKTEESKVQAEQDTQTLDEVMAELDALIGLESVKEEVHTLINFIKVQKERANQGLKSSQVSYHCVFTGSPGTGKTTVARLVTKIYKHLGVLKTGHLVETDRSGLVADYAGQTPGKVNKLVDSALDGILFIDEAYALVGDGQDDYGREAVATLLKRMEDNRDRLVLVVAGYQEDMKDFIETNPGLKSRFNRYIDFPDYTPTELMKIFELLCKKGEYRLLPKAKDRLMDVFQSLYDEKDEHFGNGRLVRNMFEQTIENQSNRIVKAKSMTKRLLTTIQVKDIPID